MTNEPFDPFALWRDMLSKWEAGFNEIAGKNIAPPEFVGELMGRYLTAMNMPSRADLAALDQRLQKIEEQLAHLAAQQAAGEATLPPEPASMSSNGPASTEPLAAIPAASAKPAQRTAKKTSAPRPKRSST